MNTNSSLEAWNTQVLMLVQALVGAVSPNFRMVTLDLDEDCWIIRFYIKEDLEEDIEEIEEILCQYTAYQDNTLKCRHEIIIGSKELPGILEIGRVIYRHRESFA